MTWFLLPEVPQSAKPRSPLIEAAIRKQIIADLLAQGWRPPRQRVRVKAEGVRI